MPDSGDGREQPSSSSSFATVRGTLLIAGVLGPLMLLVHRLVSALLDEDWRWGREIFSNLTAAFVVCGLLHLIERRQRRAKPPTTT